MSVTDCLVSSLNPLFGLLADRTQLSGVTGVESHMVKRKGSMPAPRVQSRGHRGMPATLRRAACMRSHQTSRDQTRLLTRPFGDQAAASLARFGRGSDAQWKKRH